MDAVTDASADALRTERNSAVAEAQLWFGRMLKMQKERDQAWLDVREANRCFDEWEAAYSDLLRKFRRMEVKLGHLELDLDSAEFLLRHLDPYLPRWLQTHRTPENELLYERLASCRADDALKALE